MKSVGERYPSRPLIIVRTKFSAFDLFLQRHGILLLLVLVLDPQRYFTPTQRFDVEKITVPLRFDEFPIRTVRMIHEIVVTGDFADASVDDVGDSIGGADGGVAMCDDDGRTSLGGEETFEGVLDGIVEFAVDVGGRLVQKYNVGPLQECVRQGDPLPEARGQLRSSGSYLRVVPSPQRRNFLVNVGHAARLYDLLPRIITVGVYVSGDGGVQ
mmetsp:Transcript_6639/g.19634  ORF Transcript_6639/g.19634 Transcript_6639/m.19634 type:complete len:213 (-) Transcript_6639:1027-1665(-)